MLCKLHHTILSATTDWMVRGSSISDRITDYTVKQGYLYIRSMSGSIIVRSEGLPANHPLKTQIQADSPFGGMRQVKTLRIYVH